MKAYQVLTEGNYFGKIYLVNDANDMAINALDSDDLLNKNTLRELVVRDVDIEYTPRAGQHLNVNVLQPDLLVDLATAYKMRNANYELSDRQEQLIADNSQLTIRVSGYATLFAALTDEQRADVISRTFHDKF